MADGGDGFVPLFNGKDLSGWVNINCAPETFTVRDGEIYCTGAPICALPTDRMYENFVLELERQHLEAGGNAVFVWTDPLPARSQPFLRSIEVQVLDGRNTDYYTGHGDVFAIHGPRLTPDRPHPRGAMRSLPSEWRANPAGQWNHYRITAKDGTIKLAVNGKEVSGGYDNHAAQGLHRPGVRKLAGPLPEHPRQEAALVGSARAGADRSGGRRIRVALHRRRLQGLDPPGRSRGPLGGEGLSST